MLHNVTTMFTVECDRCGVKGSGTYESTGCERHLTMKLRMTMQKQGWHAWQDAHICPLCVKKLHLKKGK